MRKRRGPGEREEVARELDERTSEEVRQRSGSTPREDVLERALDIEPGVERHAGEDPGSLAPEPSDREPS
jgi:hypothetical protein